MEHLHGGEVVFRVRAELSRYRGELVREGMDRPAASSSQMGRFETEWLATDANLAALADLSGARIVRQGRYVVFQLAEVAVPRVLFAEILRRIDRLRPRPPPLLA